MTVTAAHEFRQRYALTLAHCDPAHLPAGSGTASAVWASGLSNNGSDASTVEAKTTVTFARIGRCVVAHHRDGAAKGVTGLVVPASDRNTPPARALAPAGFAFTSLGYRSESREYLALNGLLGRM
jgi:hypothetical protein